MSIKLPKIFLDSGNPEDTKTSKGLLGFIDGQTTNPSLVAKHPEVEKLLKQGKKLKEKDLYELYRQIIQEIDKEIAGPISAEVYADWNTTASQMLEQANTMSRWGKNVYVKFPTIPEGLKAAQQFVKTGGRVNMTLVFDQTQSAAVYAACCPDSTDSNRLQPIATHFVSPFLGRWDDRGFAGLDLLKNIIKMYKKFDKQLNTKKPHVLVLAASIRNLNHLYSSIFLGADIITIPLKVIKDWVEEGKYMPDSSYRPDTQGLKSLIYEDLPFKKDFNQYVIEQKSGDLLDEGLKRFVADWKNLIA